MKTIEETWTNTDGIKIYQKTWMPDEKVESVIVLIHGIGEHICRYEHVGEYFSSHYSVLTGIDLRGHGKSGGKRGDVPCFDCFLDDIGQVVKHTKEKYPAIPLFLYGHSMGGNLIVNYVLRDKPEITGIILTSPGLKPVSTGAKWKLPVAKVINKIVPGFMVANEVDLKGLSHDKSVIENYKKDPLVQNRVSVRMGLSVIEAGKNAMEKVKQLTNPVLLLQGSDDKIVDVDTNERFAEELSTLHKVIMYPGHFHELHNEPDHNKIFHDINTWIGEVIQQDRAG